MFSTCYAPHSATGLFRNIKRNDKHTRTKRESHSLLLWCSVVDQNDRRHTTCDVCSDYRRLYVCTGLPIDPNHFADALGEIAQEILVCSNLARHWRHRIVWTINDTMRIGVETKSTACTPAASCWSTSTIYVMAVWYSFSSGWSCYFTRGSKRFKNGPINDSSFDG